MPPRSDQHAYDELIRDAERILRDAEASGLHADDLTTLPEAAPGKKELAALEAQSVESIDGSVEVRVSEDRMVARAAFFPPAGAGRLIELVDVQRLLTATGVKFGIDGDAVKSAILSCNTSRTPLRDVEVARGRKPIDELPASTVIEPSLVKKSSLETSSSATVDFKSISPFVFVKKGDTLARVTPRIEGVSGVDVTGAVVPCGKASVEPAKPGKNTLVTSDLVLAACDGRFMYRDGSFWVSEVLEVPGDVDFSTGHIDFPGDVIIKGQIKQGFKVTAGGSLYCAKLIDASEIVCGGDLETGQGILGRMQGTVKVGGTVRAKFIENCYLEAGGNVVVATGCLNSVICTLGALVTGPRGVVIGGKISAQKGVTAYQVGSSAGARTELHCGIDYTVDQKLTWIRDRNIALALKLKQVETSIASRGRADPKLLELQAKLKSAIRRMNESARSLVAALHKDEGALVVVRGDIHHGAYIEICNVSLVISAPMTRVRFRLDKAFGIISPERIS